MISEIVFAHSYGSYWHSIVPMAEQYIRRLNLQLERFDTPMTYTVEPQKRGFVNEIAFRLFKYCSDASIECDLENVGSEVLGNIIEDSIKKIELFKDDRAITSKSLSRDETLDAFGQSNRLLAYFKNKSPLYVHPIFKGCGILDECAGDVLSEDVLYEIKAGSRSFRSIDLRQLLIYCALNSESGQYDISRIGLLNPRLGVYVEMDLDQLCKEVSSKSRTELFGDIVYSISRGDMSK